MTTNASFLPEDYLARKLARRSNIVCVSLFAIVLTGIMATYFVKQRQKQVALKEHAAITLQLDQEAAKIDQANQRQEQHEELVLRSNLTSALVDPVHKSNLIVELTNHMPPLLSFTELEMETQVVREPRKPKSSLDAAAAARAKKDATPTIEIPETQVVLTMTGVAPTDVEVSEYMTALGNHQLFEDVNLVFSEQHKLHDTPLRRFKIELAVARDLTMADLEPTRVARDLAQNPMGETFQIAPDGVRAQ